MVGKEQGKHAEDGSSSCPESEETVLDVQGEPYREDERGKQGN